MPTNITKGSWCPTCARQKHEIDARRISFVGDVHRRQMLVYSICEQRDFAQVAVFAWTSMVCAAGKGQARRLVWEVCV